MEGLTEDENRYVNEWIKYTLQYAKEYNDSNEAGVMLDKSDWDNYDMVLGNKNRVSYNTERMKRCLDEGNDNIILIHNHPSNNIFSDKDILNFCKTDALNALIVVGNKGSVYLLQKLKGFDKYKLIEYYYNAFSSNKSKYTKGEILDMILRKYQRVLSIKYERQV